jgi:hypothetical protein
MQLNKQLLTGVALAVLMLMATKSQAQTSLVRGPYLQMPMSNSMTLRWRSDIASDSEVNYGTSPGSLISQASDANSTTEHEIVVTGLQPDTKYFYSVGSSSQVLAGADSSHYFKTAPLPGTVQPIRVWCIGDFGKNNTEQGLVRDAFVNFEKDNPTDLWIWLGDNAYDNGTDQEFQDKVFAGQNGYASIFPRLPFLPTPGNHDYLSIAPPTSNINPMNHSGPYYDIVNVPANGEMGGVPSGTEAYYSYDYGNVHFVSANSEIGTLVGSSNDWIGVFPLFNPFASPFSTSPFTQWLHADLAATDKRWKVVYFHQPPYTDGSHESGTFWEVYMRAMRENIVPILEQYGVDVVMNGHSHVFERSHLIKGHYGDASSFLPSMLIDGSSGTDSLGEAYVKDVSIPGGNDGTVYVVAGNAASKDSNPGLAYPAHYYGDGCDTCVGSFILDIHGDTLNGRYLKANGDIGDNFTIFKMGLTAIEPAQNLVFDVETFPNPFDGQLNIRFQIQEATEVEITLVDIAGKESYSVFSGYLGAEKHEMKVNADKLGLASGAYLLRIQAGGEVATENVTRIK